MRWRSFLGMVLWLSVSSAVWAQDDYVSVSMAKLNAIGTAGIEIKVNEQDIYKVKIDPAVCKIWVKGTAEPGVLQPGQLVQFTATPDERGIIAEPLADLSLITAREDTSIGAFPEDDGRFFICGQIREVKNGKYTVVARNAKVTFQLAQAPTITVNVNDISICQAGDSVTLRGRLVSPGAIVADDVTIDMAQPVKAPEPKPKKPKKPKKTRRTPATTEGDPAAGDATPKPDAETPKPDGGEAPADGDPAPADGQETPKPDGAGAG